MGEPQTVILPKIRATRRKVVNSSKRTRSLFSCDRCKIKKLACHRIGSKGIEQNTGLTCAMCRTLNVECKTTIKRKKRMHGPILHIGLHYKCLLVIVTALFQDKDVNNVDVLIEIGESMDLKMPSRDNGDLNEEEELRDISIRLTSSSKSRKTEHSFPEPMDTKANVIVPFRPSKVSESPSENTREVYSDPPLEYNMVYSGIPANGFGSTLSSKIRMEKYDRVIFDVTGVSHFIGPFGQAALLTALVYIVVKKTRRQKISSLEYVTNRNTEGSCISSYNQVITPQFFKLLDFREFPIINLIDKTEGDMYVDVFFRQLQFSAFCFDEKIFRDNYNKFWALVNRTDNSAELTNPQICCIYAVWLLTNHYISSTTNTLQFTHLTQNYINIIKVALSEILLCPSLDGIRCLLILSIYFDLNMQRETAFNLCELASRQALACGFHRQSLASSRVHEEAEAIKRTWWLIFHVEVNFCVHMDRPSAIALKEVNVPFPHAFLDGGYFGSYVQVLIDMNRIASSLLIYRRRLFINNELASMENVADAINIKHELEAFYENLPQYFLSLETPTIESIYLLTTFHYYVICFSLPFVFYLVSHSELSISNDDPLLELACYCLKSSIKLAVILLSAEEKDLVSLRLSYEVFCAKHAMMGILAGTILFECVNSKKIKKTIDLDYVNSHYGINSKALSDAASQIRHFNSRNIDKPLGTSRIFSDWIEVLSQDLDLVKEIFRRKAEKNNYIESSNRERGSIQSESKYNSSKPLLERENNLSNNSPSSEYSNEVEEAFTQEIQHISSESATYIAPDFDSESDAWCSSAFILDEAATFVNAFSDSHSFFVENEMIELLFGDIVHEPHSVN